VYFTTLSNDDRSQQITQGTQLLLLRSHVVVYCKHSVTNNLTTDGSTKVTSMCAGFSPMSLADTL